MWLASVTTPGIVIPSCKKLFDQQSMEADQEKAQAAGVGKIDRRLQEDQARPIVYHLRFRHLLANRGSRALRMMVNSVFNGWRFEDVLARQVALILPLGVQTMGPARTANGRWTEMMRLSGSVRNGGAIARRRGGPRPAVGPKKTGGILKMYSPDSPASMSIHEEATFVAEGPMMGVFNNLVLFDQQVKAKQASTRSWPDLATAWSWNEDGDRADLPAAPRRHLARRQNRSWPRMSSAPLTC